jgi:hypothetical protein
VSGGGAAYLDLRKGRLKSQSIVRRTMELHTEVSTCGSVNFATTRQATGDGSIDIKLEWKEKEGEKRAENDRKRK